MINVKHFDNGLQLIHEHISTVRSVSVGIFVGTGSNYELGYESGISHFIEHMLFKGTTNRSAQKIANDIESIGAQINAYTGKEITSYYTVSLDNQVENCIDVLSDIYFNSVFSQDQMNKEKGVVKEEIKMCEDTPDDTCYELLLKAMYEGSAIANPILGNYESLDKISREDIFNYMKDRYTADNTVISIVGNIDFDKAIDLVAKYFVCNYKNIKSTVFDNKFINTFDKYYKKVKNIEQSNICLGYNSLPYNDEKEFDLLVFNEIFGGSMSSRLFQSLREEMGFVYSVYSYPSAGLHNGYFTIYLGASECNVEKSIIEIAKQTKLICNNGISNAELNRAKAQIKTSFCLSQENTKSCMSMYGKYLLLTGNTFDIDRKLALVDNVTVDSVQAIANEIINTSNCAIAYVGPDLKIDPKLTLQNAF